MCSFILWVDNPLSISLGLGQKHLVYVSIILSFAAAEQYNNEHQDKQEGNQKDYNFCPVSEALGW